MTFPLRLAAREPGICRAGTKHSVRMTGAPDPARQAPGRRNSSAPRCPADGHWPPRTQPLREPAMRPVVVLTPSQFREYRRRRRDLRLTIFLLAALIIALAAALNAHPAAHRGRTSPACATASPATPPPAARPVPPPGPAGRGTTCDRADAHRPARRRDPS